MKVNRLSATPIAIALVASLLVFIAATPSQAATSPVLGAANNFALLAGGGLSNAGSSTVQGEIGIYPTISYIDTGSISLSGGYHFGDANVVAATSAANAAYASAQTSTPSTALTADLGGQTLTPGAYSNPNGLSINGVLTLDGKGDQNAVYIFQTPTALTTSAASHITLINGVQACNVFWQVGTTSNLGAGSDFKGNLLGNSQVILGNTATVLGRVFSLHGNVTMSANSIVKPSCVTFTKVASVITGLTPASGTFLPGAVINLSSKVTPKSGSLVCTGAVSYSLNKNPITGVTGTFVLVSPVATNNWQLGSYHLTAMYPGDVSCQPSTTSADLKFGATTQNAISGNGSYGTAAARNSFSISLRSLSTTGSTAPTISGKLTWEQRKTWKFQGTLNTWVLSNNINTATGSGTLWFYNTKNHGNKWIQATTGNALVTVLFASNQFSVGEHSRSISSFAIGFSGVPVVGIPVLPALGSLVSVSGGNDD